MKQAIYMVLAILALTGAAAIQEVTVESGELIRVSDTILATDPITSLVTTYRVLGTDFEQVFSATNPRSAIVTHTFPLDVPEGTYVLETTYDINEGIEKRTELLLHVIGTAPHLLQDPTTRATTRRTGRTTTPFVPDERTVIIPAIPDVNPGETFVMPVTIRGDGLFTIEIPKLSFATYEAPLTVTVDGERTLPVLIHIDTDATPGTYVIPVRVNGEESDARVRIIAYRTQAPIWPLLLAGLILVIVGAVVIALATTKRRPRSRVSPPDEPELITYY